MENEQNCLFCRISNKSLPATIVYEDDQCLAFNDIHPQAPTHVLVIPKKHITSLDELTPEDAPLVGHCLVTLATIAREQEIAEKGYRTIINTKHHGGQEVDHLHIHLLGGEPLGPMRSK